MKTIAAVFSIAAADTRRPTAKIPMTGNPKPLYEFACHEGNYSLPGILEGARRHEAETSKQRTNPSST